MMQVIYTAYMWTMVIELGEAFLSSLWHKWFAEWHMMLEYRHVPLETLYFSYI